MGGYGAIMFGMLLGADRIVAFGPLSHLDPSEAILYGDRRFLPVMEALQADPPKSAYLDLPQLGEALHYQGDLHVIFGTHPGHDDGVRDNLDALHALRLARLPNVTLAPYPESAHPVVQWLIEHEQIDDLLAKRLVPEPPVDEPMPATSTAGSSSDSEIPNKIATKLYRSFKFHVVNTSHHDDGTGQVVSYAAVGQGNLEPAHRVGVDDDWRCWIAENLILGASPVELEEVLAGRGISETEACPRSLPGASESLFLGNSAVAEPAQEARLAVRQLSQAPAASPRIRDDRAAAQTRSRRVARPILQRQSPRHHHRHDGRLAGPSELESRLILRSGSATGKSRSSLATILATSVSALARRNGD